MKIYPIIVAALLLSACALPDTAVKTGSPRPTLAIKGAPAGSTLVVDGLVMGPAVQFNGEPNVLLLEEGVHQVEIRLGGAVVHTEKTAMSNGELRIVTVNGGEK